MRARFAVIVSVLAHAGVLIAAARGLTGGAAEHAVAPAAVVTVEVVPAARAPAPAPDELIVELHVDPVAAPATRAASAAPASHRRAAPATASAADARVTTGATAARGELTGPAAEPAPGGALAIRGLRHDLALSRDTLERVAGGPGAARAEAPVVPSGKLVQRGREHVIDDETVAIRIRPDGSVAMHDKPDFDIHIGLPSLSQLRKLFGGHVREAFEEGPMFVPMIWGRADVTAALMRRTGAGDPYSSRKQRLLDETRAERVEIGARYRADLHARSAELIQRNLEALWRTITDPAARRAALFELWDECTEDEAGTRARAMVIGWIGRHAPAGGPLAYADAEVTRLDASRTSRAHFVPYPPRD